MAIEIKEVQSKRDFKSFIYFPFWLYRKNKYWVPPMIKDEKMAFNRDKNPMFETGDAKLFLVFKDRRIAGRVAVLANRSELENEKKIRFGWLDFEDDREVTDLLFEAVEEAAKELGATQIEGPLGFTDLDKAGLLIEGFQEENNMTTWYNFSYYQKHLERLGYEKKQDWVEYLFTVPDAVPARVAKLSALIKERYKLVDRPIKNKADMRKISVDVLKLMSETYKNLYNFVPLQDHQMAFYAEQFLNFLPTKNVVVLEDASGKFVAFAVTMPSLVKAAKKTKGHLFPFGFLSFLRAMKKNNKVELLLIGVHPDFQNKGITAVIFEKLINVFIEQGIKTVESNPEQEENQEVQTLWKDYDSRQHKRRRVFQKSIA